MRQVASKFDHLTTLTLFTFPNSLRLAIDYYALIQVRGMEFEDQSRVI